MNRRCREPRPPSRHLVADRHAGHAGNPGGGPDAETHFRVKVVSEEFTGRAKVQRHRLVYGLLKEELEAGVHALALKTKTPEEDGG